MNNRDEESDYKDKLSVIHQQTRVKIRRPQSVVAQSHQVVAVGPSLKPMQVDGGAGTGNGDEQSKHMVSHRELLHVRKNTDLVQPSLNVKKRKIDHKQYLTKQTKRKELTDSRLNLPSDLDVMNTISSQATVGAEEIRRHSIDEPRSQMQSFSKLPA